MLHLAPLSFDPFQSITRRFSQSGPVNHLWKGFPSILPFFATHTKRGNEGKSAPAAVVVVCLFTDTTTVTTTETDNCTGLSLSLSIHPHSPFLSLFPSFILFSITAHDQSGKLEVVGLVVVIICRQNWKETSAKPQCWWIAAATKTTTTTTDTITVAATAAELVTVWSLAAVTKNPELRLRALTSGFSLSSTQSSEGRGRRNEDWGTDWRGKKKGLGLLIHTNACGGSGGDGENGEKKEETNCHCHQLKKRERKGERESSSIVITGYTYSLTKWGKAAVFVSVCREAAINQRPKFWVQSWKVSECERSSN